MDEQIIKQVAEHEVRLKNVEDNQVKLTEKVEDIHKIANAVEVIAHDMGYMKDDLSEVKVSQGELKNSYEELHNELVDVRNAPDKKTAERVKTVVDKFIWLFIGGVAVYLLTQIFPAIKW